MSGARLEAGPAERELLLAKERSKKELDRVKGLKKQLEGFLKTLKNWQHCAETTACYLATSVDPDGFEVGRELKKWSEAQTELTEQVTNTLGATFQGAVMDPIAKWLDSFKAFKAVLKEFTDARSSRDHYVSKMKGLRDKQAKGKCKPDKMQRNQRKLASAMSEYGRVEAASLVASREFFTKCHNYFIIVTARFSQFQERLCRELHNEYQSYGPWAVKILKMKEENMIPLGRFGNNSNGSGGGGGGGGGAAVHHHHHHHSGGGGASSESGRDSSNYGGRDSAASSSGVDSGFGGSGDGFGRGGQPPPQQPQQQPQQEDTGWGDGWGGDGGGANVAASAPPMDDGFGDFGDGGGFGGGGGNNRGGGGSNGGGDDGFGLDWGDGGGDAAQQPAVPPLPEPGSAAGPTRPARKSSPSADFDGFGDFGGLSAADLSAAPSAPAPLPQQQQQQQQGGANPFADFF